jgi:hypothetical protein
MVTRQERLDALERQTARLAKRKVWLGNTSQDYWNNKMLLFVGGCIFLILLIITLPIHWLGLLFLPLAVIAFFVLSRNHQKIDKSYVKHEVFLKIKQTQLARMRLDWDALPPQLESDSTDHPFEIDLDIMGERSLHRLMNTAVSFEGGLRLSKWLLEPDADLGAIRRRQSFVQELVPLTIFREKLLLHSLRATRYTDDQYDESDLLKWLKTEQETNVPRSTLYVPTLACAATVLLVVLGLFKVVPLLLFIIPIIFSAIWFLATQKRYTGLFKDANRMRIAFEQLSEIFAFLETYRYSRNQQLKKLCEPFFAGRRYRPSELLRKLSGLARRAMFSQNAEVQFFLNALIPLDTYTAYQLSQYKTHVLRLLPEWLDSWFELEALCSLASFAYLNPDYTLPRLLPTDDKSQQPVFEAQTLGHPLIPASQSVTNDFALQTNNEILLLTGSNMAGKSTFLRTIGINLCLAYAGGPVNAASLRASLFEIYACIKVIDSLADGYSYFYAEVRRLQGLLERLKTGQTRPMFFLIDEIFKGTNNDERLIGSSAYIHALVGQNCVGAISTHDLELVKLSDDLPMLLNYHFREDVVDGQMVFDYKLHDGPCPTRNALKIMQLAGLPISWEGQPEASLEEAGR